MEYPSDGELLRRAMKEVREKETEIERLRDGIAAHERAARQDYEVSEWGRLAPCDEALWALLDESR